MLSREKKSNNLIQNWVKNYGKDDTKIINAILPANHPKKELSNKQAKFECKILNVKKPKQTKIDDDFAKLMGAKDIKDLKSLIEKQISKIEKGFTFLAI